MIASSPSDVSRDGQSVSDSWTLGTFRRDLSVGSHLFVFLMTPPAAGVDTSAISREHVAVARVRNGELRPAAPLAESMLRRPGSATVNFDRQRH